MYRVCQVNHEDMYNQNSRKMHKVLNQAELVNLTSELHFKETTNDLKFDPLPKGTLDRRKLLDCVSRLYFEKEDSEIIQNKQKRDVEHVENKIDHLTMMAEVEGRRSLR